jgi:hypothetical protein
MCLVLERSDILIFLLSACNINFKTKKKILNLVFFYDYVFLLQAFFFLV